MPADHLNLEDFPNSAYAHELRRGLKRMRFEAPLEQQEEVHLDGEVSRQRDRIRVAEGRDSIDSIPQAAWEPEAIPMSSTEVEEAVVPAKRPKRKAPRKAQPTVSQAVSSATPVEP